MRFLSSFILFVQWLLCQVFQSATI